jgi:6-phosphogluconolactonase
MEIAVTTPIGAATAAAHLIADRISQAAGRGKRFSIALSGGRTPWLMLDVLVAADVEWSIVDVFQVDERIAPLGDDQRNLTKITERLGSTAATIVPMPVNDVDLIEATGRYGAALPDCFDVVQLGMGADGHTASLVPGDPILDLVGYDVAISVEYQGTQRMTLTYERLVRAREIFWIVTGDEKADAMALWRASDQSIPASRIVHDHQIMVTDVSRR